MKKIEAIIKPFKLDEVRDALFEVGIGGMTVSEVEGFGRDCPGTQRGLEPDNDPLPKVKIEIVLTDGEVKPVVSAILSAARTGKIGDGKVIVSLIRQAVRIRTEEKDGNAL